MADIQTNFPVSVSNFPSTQTVSVSNFPVTQPISGTISVGNFPATQPVSGTVNVGNFPASQTVSVSNFPATQPISGTVSISNFPASGEVGTGIVNYYESDANIANAAAGAATYTVTTGKTFYLKQVLASSSGGPCKVVLVTGAGGSAVTQAVAFYTAAVPFVNITFAQPIPLAAGTPINLQIWNLAGQAMDVYGTINGHEV